VLLVRIYGLFICDLVETCVRCPNLATAPEKAAALRVLFMLFIMPICQNDVLHIAGLQRGLSTDSEAHVPDCLEDGHGCFFIANSIRFP